MSSAHSPKNSARAQFAALLRDHMDRGMRPVGARKRGRWQRKELMARVGVSLRTLDYYRSGRMLPANLALFLDAFFGDDPARAESRATFIRAFDEAQGLVKIVAEASASVPRPTSNFVGRVEDMEILLPVLLSASESVSILLQGGPGIGKTTLTQAIAHRPEVRQHFGQDNCWFVPLETATTAETMRNAIKRALGCEPTSDFTSDFVRLVNGGGLLILDNLETPWDSVTERKAVEATLAELATVPGLALLTSFRGRDRVGGPKWAIVHPVVGLGRQLARDLFCQIADWKTPDDSILAKFLDALGGVPLAIELVARRAFGDLSLEPLWKQWMKIGAELATHPDFAADRLSSLPHSIELSIQSGRMTSDALRLFRLLGRLPAGLATEDRDALIGDGSFQARESLLRVGVAVERGTRLDLLPPIRSHAFRQHSPHQADEIAWRNHYLGLIAEIGEKVGRTGGDEALDRLRPEFANLEAAFRAAIVSGARDEAMGARLGFQRLTYFEGIPSPVLAELATFCRANADIAGEAYWTRADGEISLRRSDFDSALRAYRLALPLFRKAEDALGETNCMERIGEIALQCADPETARRAYEEVLPLYRRIGNVLGEANCFLRLGDIMQSASDYKAAQAAYDKALPLYQQIESVLGEANCLQSLGDLLLACSDVGGARPAYQGALLLYRRIGDPLGEANCVWSLGDIALRYLFDPNAARDAFEKALLLYRKMGSVLGEANCTRSLGDVALTFVDHERARVAFEDALPLYRRVRNVLGEAHCIAGLGDIALGRSDHAAARGSYEQALLLYRRIGHASGKAHCLARIASLPR